MAISAYKVFSSGEVLTASDLNASLNNILNNPVDLWSPAGKSADMNGFELVLDADADSSITVDTDDRLDIRLFGVDLFVFDGTGVTLVNGITFTGAASLSGPTIAATGSDTNIAVTLKGKGTGHVVLGQATSTDVRLAADQPIADSSGNEFIKFSKTGAAVNEVSITNAATGSAPQLAATGGDANIQLVIKGKGTGVPYSHGLIVSDITDTTKAAQFVLTSVTTGNTRTITVPDRNITLHDLSAITNSLGGDVTLNNAGAYFTGPSVAQGTSGTWFASGTVVCYDTAGAAVFNVKLWDGTTVIASAVEQSNAANQTVAISVSGPITSPAGNIRISVQDTTATSGVIAFNSSGNSKDSTVTAIRVA